jgi:hypothetical protein
MNIETLRHFFLVSALSNYAILLIWFAVFSLAHNGLYRLHRLWFALSLEQFDRIHYQLMGFYKIGILLFNLAPYIALAFQ